MPTYPAAPGGVYELVSVPQKETALASFLEGVFDAFGENFRVYTNPRPLQLDFTARIERSEFMENDAGEIRMCEVYWEGWTQGSGPERGGGTRQTLDGAQYGTAHVFRIVLHYGLDRENPDASYDAFKALLTAHEPNKGILPTIGETPALDVAGETVSMGYASEGVVPPIPRPLDDSGEDRAHYLDFSVVMQDG
jgi:hypothetical protein